MRISEVTADIVVYHGNQGGIHRELITPMWWTESYDDAKYYATQFDGDGWVYRARLTCKNPYLAQPEEEINNLVNHSKKLMSQGYDCIHDPRAGDWIPFYAKDIQLIGQPEFVES
jgi:hypothetical protein